MVSYTTGLQKTTAWFRASHHASCSSSWFVFPSHWLHFGYFRTPPSPSSTAATPPPHCFHRLKNDWEEPVPEPLLKGTTQAFCFFFSLHYNQSQSNKKKSEWFNSFRERCLRSWKLMAPRALWTCSRRASRSSWILSAEQAEMLRRTRHHCTVLFFLGLLWVVTSTKMDGIDLTKHTVYENSRFVLSKCTFTQQKWQHCEMLNG